MHAALGRAEDYCDTMVKIHPEFHFDPALMRAIGLGQRPAPATKEKTVMLLDRLLPAHWVGVWQRQQSIA
jgi:hypothetical protein